MSPTPNLLSTMKLRCLNCGRVTTKKEYAAHRKSKCSVSAVTEYSSDQIIMDQGLQILHKFNDSVGIVVLLIDSLDAAVMGTVQTGLWRVNNNETCMYLSITMQILSETHKLMLTKH